MDSAPTQSRQTQSDATDYDVVIIGGALAGSSAATLLRRNRPDCRVLVVEFREEFPHKVGEATVEISGLFLHRVLAQYDHLSREHLPKHGLRYWFTDGQSRGFDEMTEVGPYEAPRLPSFQLDRSRLDEHLLGVSQEEGAEVLRPQRVVSHSPGWPISQIELEGEDGQRRTVSTRWVVDASGRHAFIARRKKLLERQERHPIAAAWGRWEGAMDLDGPTFQSSLGQKSVIPDIPASRRLATNHFCGYGWWSWVIPLANGKSSIGVVYNKELFKLPGEGTSKERYEAFIRSQPGLRDLVEHASLDSDDCLSYSHIPYCTKQYMDRGWALIGDAASFIDPYYSPGLDHLAISTFATVELILKDLNEELQENDLMKAIVGHNEAFQRSYHRWLDALYLGKYRLFGDAELTACAFLVDTAMYYFGVVSPAYRNLEALRNPIFGIALPQATVAFKVARFFNRRLQKIAGRKIKNGTYGARNVGWRLFAPSFGLGRAALAPLMKGLSLWLRLELRHLFGPRKKQTATRLSAAERSSTP